MLNQVRSGDIHCIIVKDLSRFGRNYLEVGDYLEHIFPFLNVRVIAVNDHYDSDSYVGTTGGIDVAFRNLIYQRYSQDLSEKVRSAMHMKMSKGKYVVHCLYGYRKKPGVKHEMIPDPVTAPIVREIFLLAISGKKSIEIAAILNDRGIQTPMAYKQLKRKDIYSDAMWSHQAVLRILKDYKYTGAMVNFKCENETIRASAQRRCRPEEWTITPDCHEAIVTQEEYEAANAMIRRVRPGEKRRSDCRDRVYYCAYCGRRLRKTYGLDEYYSCTSSLYRKGSQCAGLRWSRTELETVVLEAYKVQLDLMNKVYEKSKEIPKIDPTKECWKSQKSIMKEISAFDSQSLQLYEQYREGILGREAFLDQKAALHQRKEELQNQLQKLQQQESELVERQKSVLASEQVMKESLGKLEVPDDELKNHMYDDINKVIVYADEELEIQWKFDVDFCLRNNNAQNSL